MKERPLLCSTEIVQSLIDDIKSMTRRLTGLDVVNEDPDEVTFHGFQEYPDGTYRAIFQHSDSDEPGSVICPYGKPGDRLYVRENWKLVGWDWEDSEVRIQFADGVTTSFPLGAEDYDEKAVAWLIKQVDKLVVADIFRPAENTEDPFERTDKVQRLSPSIHLPKWASRIWLEVTDISIERLQDISREDAIAEGIKPIDKLGLLAWPDYAGFSRKGYFLDNSEYSYPDGKNPQTGAVASFCTLWFSINGKESWDSNPWVWVIRFNVLSTTGPDIELYKQHQTI